MLKKLDQGKSVDVLALRVAILGKAEMKGLIFAVTRRMFAFRFFDDSWKLVPTPHLIEEGETRTRSLGSLWVSVCVGDPCCRWSEAIKAPRCGAMVGTRGKAGQLEHWPQSAASSATSVPFET